MKSFVLENGWTGWQFYIFRMLLGLYLLAHFVHLVPWSPEVFSSQGMLGQGDLSPLLRLFPNILILNDSPLFVQGMALFGAFCAVGMLFGYRVRVMAALMMYILACFYGRNPLIANPSLPYTGFMLLCVAFIPHAGFGSPRRGQSDLDVGRRWSLPQDIFLATWLILALTYSYSGYTKLLSPSWVAGDNIRYVLLNPLARDYFLRDFFLWLPPVFLQCLTWAVLYIELFFAPLALFRRLRPLLWGLMAIIQCGFACLLNFFDLTAAMLLFHLLTFDPAWVRPRGRLDGMVLYYDGTCGFCHGVVRFLLAEDRAGLIRFAPLQGDSFRAALSEAQRASLPDSIVLVADGGQAVKLKSDAVAAMLMEIGGLWRVAGLGLILIPAPVRNWGYDLVGRYRKSLKAKPDGLCPLVPAELRQRFLA